MSFMDRRTPFSDFMDSGIVGTKTKISVRKVDVKESGIRSGRRSKLIKVPLR